MPLYEYQCRTCGRFEVIRKFSDAPLVACPTCGGEVQKLLSAPAIQFKGTGWYITDYARKSSGGESKKEGESKQDGSARSEGAKKDSGASKDSGSSSESSSSTPTPSTSKDTAASGSSPSK